MAERNTVLGKLLKVHEERILTQWLQEQKSAGASKISNQDLKSQCQEFLHIFIDTVHSAESDTVHGSNWDSVKRKLVEITKSRSTHGFTPSETAMFIFSLKRPVFDLMRQELSQDAQKFADCSWSITQWLDHLGVFSMEVYQKARDEIIIRQQEEMLELSTPVVKLWDGILALPMIGTLDSSRTQSVMEALLQKIMETGSEQAIIDITGVPTVDTLVAQHLIKTVTAARLMGAECIISGIRPQIAATIVHLGVDLSGVITKASMSDAFVLALSRSGRTVTRTAGSTATRDSRS